MVSEKKSLLKRILSVIITIILIFSAVSMTVTKVVYDRIFTRYDCELSALPTELDTLVSTREEHRYSSGKNTLSGYLYRSQSGNAHSALIVIAPGFNACADNYLWQIKSLLDYGWSVFAFNTTGCCSSSGNSAIGFPQEVLDLEATLEHIENNNRFGFLDIALLGHSRGGYAACCTINSGFDISAVVSVSGINSAMEGVIGSSVEQVGPLAYGNYGFLWAYQAMLFGTNTLNLNAAEEISKSDTPCLIIHGENDSDVPLDRFSIISHKEDIKSDNVEYLICRSPQNSGHTDLLFDNDNTANDYLLEKINAFLIKQVK